MQQRFEKHDDHDYHDGTGSAFVSGNSASAYHVVVDDERLAGTYRAESLDRRLGRRIKQFSVERFESGGWRECDVAYPRGSDSHTEEPHFLHAGLRR